MSIIRILISIAGYICCILALGYLCIMIDNWTAYFVAPIAVLITIEFFRFLSYELKELKTIEEEKDFEDSLLHDQDPRERE